MTTLRNTRLDDDIGLITANDSPSIDSFGRWRVSEPQTLFDSKNIFNDDGLGTDVENQPLFWDNQLTAGTDATTLYSPNESMQSIAVALETEGTRVRQTKMRFNYQPGKSQLVLVTFNMNGGIAHTIKRVGYFDENNGLFLELNGTTVNLVKRTYTSGSPVDTAIAQANWNLDKLNGYGASGITLDFTKTQILLIDFEWLGVGRVRMGFVIAGKVYYAHEFLNANVNTNVYMSTPNLPVRYEISNDGAGAVTDLDCICSSVMSEGGTQDLGIVRYASTGGTHVDANTENTVYAIIGIRLKAEYIGATIKLLNISLVETAGSKKLEWMLLLNPTVANTFTYADEIYSAVQTAKGATANTVTNGILITGGFFESAGTQGGNAGSTSSGIQTALTLGSTISGTVDTIVLCVRPIGGSTNTDVEGSISWRELI